MTSVGTYLRELRERRGVPLAEIARTTRVAQRYLEALEADDHNKLPVPVFTRGYVRAYCQALGEAPDEALACYDSRDGQTPAPPPPRPAPASRAGESRSRSTVVASLVLLVVLGIALFTVALVIQPRDRGERVASEPRPTPPPAVAPTTPEPAAAPPPATPPAATPPVATPVVAATPSPAPPPVAPATPAAPPAPSSPLASPGATAPAPQTTRPVIAPPPTTAPAPAVTPAPGVAPRPLTGLSQAPAPPPPAVAARPAPPITPTTATAPASPATTEPGATTARPPIAVPNLESLAGGVVSPYRLIARTNEATWIRVRTEDGRSSEETVPAGEVREWISDRPFVVTVGNAAGVSLELNGRTLPPLGGRGAVIPRLVLPPDNR